MKKIFVKRDLSPISFYMPVSPGRLSLMNTIQRHGGRLSGVENDYSIKLWFANEEVPESQDLLFSTDYIEHCIISQCLLDLAKYRISKGPDYDMSKCNFNDIMLGLVTWHTFHKLQGDHGEDGRADKLVGTPPRLTSSPKIRTSNRKARELVTDDVGCSGVQVRSELPAEKVAKNVEKTRTSKEMAKKRLGEAIAVAKSKFKGEKFGLVLYQDYVIKVGQKPPFEGGKGYRKNYTYYKLIEDIHIIRHITYHNLEREVKGTQMWKKMEKKFGRSWQSLKNRYLRYILPCIEAYGVTLDTVNKLRFARRKPSARSARKSSGSSSSITSSKHESKDHKTVALQRRLGRKLYTCSEYSAEMESGDDDSSSLDSQKSSDFGQAEPTHPRAELSILKCVSNETSPPASSASTAGVPRRLRSHTGARSLSTQKPATRTSPRLVHSDTREIQTDAGFGPDSHASESPAGDSGESYHSARM